MVLAFLQEKHLILRVTQCPLLTGHFLANDFRDLSHDLAVQRVSGRPFGNVSQQRHFSPQPRVVSALDISRNKPLQK
jgi:hypothetical protein